ncbi:MAG TPA: iron-containing alcohol dehydrogenase [Pseudohaliea sp.]|nr:iron-containing alcohol dehydrogenase [Pseudohaliea sp.]
MLIRKLKHSLYFALVKVLVAFAPSVSYLAFAGPGSSRQLGEHILRGGQRRLLVVTDKPLRELGIADKAVEALVAGGAEIAWYDGVEPNPTFSQVDAGIAALKAHGAEAVLAVGGGSSIDAAKVIAAGGGSDEDPRTWIGFGKVKHDVMPIYVIPTTAGTGSEATMGAVISDSDTREKGVLSGKGLQPAAVALDSDLMLGMPPAITAATGMDALTHAIEAYISTWDRGTRTAYSRQAIRMIFDHLRTAYEEGTSREARDAMAMAAYYAGIAINQVNVGNVHAIAHQIGGRYGIPHGLANALVLPHVLEFCRDEAEEKLAELAVLVGAAGTEQPRGQQADAFIAAVRELSAAVGIPETTAEVKAEDFDYLVDLAVNEAAGYFAPRLLDPASTRAILGRIAA